VSLLEIEDLSVEFTSRRGVLKALDKVSLTLEPGEFLGMVGESGAGKSMTGNAILGLIDHPGKISGGDIRLHGESIINHPERIRGSHISMIFQDPLSSLNPLKTIGAQLIETIELHTPRRGAESKQRAGELMSQIGVDADRLSAYPHQFSGGMRQRVVIALAMASEPEIIIADEPTTALDVSVQAQVLDLLREVCKAHGTAVILITHDMGVIGHWTDRVGVLYAGRLIEIGSTNDIIRSPRHPYTQGLIASTPTMDANVNTTLYQIPGNMPPLTVIPAGCAFNPRCPITENKCRKVVPQLINDVACHLRSEA
jgi:peptide/nickel transport system ATP-binding protein